MLRARKRAATPAFWAAGFLGAAAVAAGSVFRGVAAASFLAAPCCTPAFGFETDSSWTWSRVAFFAAMDLQPFDQTVTLNDGHEAADLEVDSLVNISVKAGHEEDHVG